MLDIKYIKEKPDEVVARLAKKGKDAKYRYFYWNLCSDGNGIFPLCLKWYFL